MIKNGVFDILGRAVKELLVLEECASYPNWHLFLVFSDNDSAYEFYSGAGDSRIHSASGLFKGIDYAKSFTNCKKITRYYKDEHGRNKIEEIDPKSLHKGL